MRSFVDAMKRFAFLVLAITLAFLVNPSLEFGFGRGGPQPLYDFKDRGIVSLNITDFKINVLDSDRAWIVEFYSSYCGHCVHFAPTYKEFSEEIYGELIFSDQ